MMPSLRAAYCRWASHYLSVLRHAQEQYLGREDTAKSILAFFDQDWPLVQAMQAWSAANAAEDEEAAALCSAFGESATSVTGGPLRDLRQRPEEYLRWLDAGIAAARRIGDRRAEASQVYDRAQSLLAWGQPERGTGDAEHARTLFQDIGDGPGECATLNLLGLAASSRGESERALDYHEQALAVARYRVAPDGESYSLDCLGSVYRTLKRYDRAAACHQQVLTLARAAGSDRDIVNALVDLGLDDFAAGADRSAAGHFDQALAFLNGRDELLDHGGYATALAHIGTAYTQLGHFDLGVACLRRNLALMQSLGNRPGECAAQLALGVVHGAAGADALARAALGQALALAQENGEGQLEVAVLRQLERLSSAAADATSVRDTVDHAADPEHNRSEPEGVA